MLRASCSMVSSLARAACACCCMLLCYVLHVSCRVRRCIGAPPCTSHRQHSYRVHRCSASGVPLCAARSHTPWRMVSSLPTTRSRQNTAMLHAYYMQRYYIHTQCAICNTQHTKCDIYPNRICGYRSGTAPTASWLLHVVLRDERCMLPVARCMRYIACLMLLVACCI